MSGNDNEKPGSIPSMGAKGDQLKDETVIVVAGASGDLAKKKTFPALFALFHQDLLPKDVHIVGYARTKMDDKKFQEHMIQGLQKPEDKELAKTYDDKVKEFQKISSYISGQYDKDDGFKELTKHIEELEGKGGKDGVNRLFYLALPPSVFAEVAKHLRQQCYTENGKNRIIIEKPFGKDTDSCNELLSSIAENWKENDTYRIDHYLGKEMVKNILVMRFSNVIFDACLNRNYVDNVQITFKEPFGTEGRGGYFDEYGIIRDVCQNHLLQAMSIFTMERPVSFGPEDIRDEKVKVLRAIPPIKKEEVILGQYEGNGKEPGYLEDEGVPDDSNCPTWAAMVLHVNNPRWEGVPFVMKAGKALDEAKVEIRVQFKDATSGIFENISRNELVIRLSGGEAVYFKLNAKIPGFETRAIPVDLDLTYKDRFENARIPQAYEALILDAIKGDHSNFVRDDELDVAWKIFTPILHWIDGKDGDKPKPTKYKYGSRGPEGMDEFVGKYGFKRSNEDYEWPTTDVKSNL